MRSTILCSLAAAGALAAAGCDTTAPAYSFVGGTIDQSSFPSPVQRITVASDSGVVETAAVDAKTGAFELELVWGSTYVFFLSPDGKGTPLVTRTGSQGALEVQVKVKTGGASTDIGAVRYWPGAKSASSTTSPGACTAGFLAGTKQPCSTSAAALACAGQVQSAGWYDQGSAGVDTSGGIDQGDQDSDTDSASEGLTIARRDHHGGGDRGGDGDGDQGGGDGDGGGLQASPDLPMAVPTLSLPAELGCQHGHDHHHDHGDDGDR
jgi:hypothetical protein